MKKETKMIFICLTAILLSATVLSPISWSLSIIINIIFGILLGRNLALLNK